MTDHKTAMEVYQRLLSSPWLGPFPIVYDEIEERSKAVFKEALKLVQQEVRQKGDGIFWAPSAWHAAVLGLVGVEYSAGLSAEEVDEASVIERGTLTGHTLRQRPLFRGQSDSEWDLSTTLDRLERKHRATETCAVEVFCALLERLSSATGIVLPARVHISTGRHYRLASRMLDFTVDPAVAVYFAATGERRREDQQASLFVLRHHDAVISHKARILLPPPFVTRLYAQRGLFVEVKESGGARRLRKDCWEFRFPLDPSFKIIRDGTPVNISPPDPWLENAIKWDRNCALDHKHFPKDPQVTKAILDRACVDLNCSEFLNQTRISNQIPDWLYFLFEMLAWLMVRVTGSGEVYGLDMDVWEVLKRDNPGLIEMFLDNSKALAKRLRFSDEAKLANTLYEFFQKMSPKAEGNR